jgi:hypothetical protein
MTYEEWLLSLCLWREARGSTIGALRAIYWVLQNRASDHFNRWPKDIPGVILQPKQFSSFNAGDPNATKFPLKTNPLDYAAFLSCQSIAQSPGDDPTGGANHYESLPSDPGHPKPGWCDPLKITCKIGAFTFYRL